MEQTYKLDTREDITIDNINVIYFDLKQAQSIAEVSNQTLYTYASDTTNNIKMIKFKGKNYLHIDDIERIKKEVQSNKVIRNSAAITLKEKEIVETEDVVKLKEEIKALSKSNADLLEELREVRQANILKDTTIANLQADLSKYEDAIKELKEEVKKERNDRLTFMSKYLEVERELGELREFKKNTANLNEIIKALSNEKDELYKSQINSLVEANSEIMDKFDKMIDTQNAFQVMLAQKEHTSQKLLDEKREKGFFTKLFGK